MIDQSVDDVMTTYVRTVTEDMTASELAMLFAEHSIGSAVVTDGPRGSPIGIVTESDVMRQVAIGADIERRTVGSFLSEPLISVTSATDIHEAASRMKANSIRRLPVIDDGELVGILTTTDLTHYLPRLRNAVVRGRTSPTTD